MPIHLIVTPHNPIVIIKKIINTSKSEIYYIDKQHHKGINIEYVFEYTCGNIFKNISKRVLCHIPFKSKDEIGNNEYIEQLECLNLLLKDYDSNNKKHHIVISVTDAYNIPAYITERIDYLYVNNQKTMRSLMVLYNNWFHTICSDVKEMKKMFDNTCKTNRQYSFQYMIDIKPTINDIIVDE